MSVCVSRCRLRGIAHTQGALPKPIWRGGLSNRAQLPPSQLLGWADKATAIWKQVVDKHENRIVFSYFKVFLITRRVARQVPSDSAAKRKPSGQKERDGRYDFCERKRLQQCSQVEAKRRPLHIFFLRRRVATAIVAQDLPCRVPCCYSRRCCNCPMHLPLTTASHVSPY